MITRISFFALLVLALLCAPCGAHARYLNTETGRFQTMDSYEGSSEEPMSLHRYQYAAANPVNMVDPSGYDPFGVTGSDFFTSFGSQFTASQPSKTIQARAILAILAVDGRDSVANKMISFYMNNKNPEAVFMLTEQQMKECNIKTSDFRNWTYDNVTPGINIAQGRGFQRYRDQLNGSGVVTIPDMQLPLRACQGKTLGLFTGHVSGVLRGSPSAWSFEGTVWFYDYWDLFHKKNADPARNAQVWAGRTFIPGTPFYINSPKAPFSQTAQQAEGDWIGKGGFPTSNASEY